MSVLPGTASSWRNERRETASFCLFSLPRASLTAYSSSAHGGWSWTTSNATANACARESTFRRLKLFTAGPQVHLWCQEVFQKYQRWIPPGWCARRLFFTLTGRALNNNVMCEETQPICRFKFERQVQICWGCSACSAVIYHRGGTSRVWVSL